MLDYAANGTKYWPLTKLQQAVEETAASDSTTADDLIRELRDDPDTDIDEFWRIVQSNLSAGRIRMVFVADKLPGELVRIIEFLNEQMRPAEVLGVEVRQYVGAGGEHVAYVPDVIGKTSRAIVAKEAAAGGQQWTEQSLLDSARALVGNDELKLIQRLIDDVHAQAGRLSFGRGASPGVSGWYVNGTQQAAIWNLNIGNGNNARAYLSLYVADLLKRVPVATIELAAERLEKIPAWAPKIAEARARTWAAHPTVYMTDIAAASADLDVLLDAIHLIAGGLTVSSSQAAKPNPASSASGTKLRCAVFAPDAATTAARDHLNGPSSSEPVRRVTTA